MRCYPSHWLSANVAVPIAWLENGAYNGRPWIINVYPVIAIPTIAQVLLRYQSRIVPANPPENINTKYELCTWLKLSKFSGSSCNIPRFVDDLLSINDNGCHIAYWPHPIKLWIGQQHCKLVHLHLCANNNTLYESNFWLLSMKILLNHKIFCKS